MSAQPVNNAHVRIRSGPLVGPVLGRVVGMLAARAQMPIDRLDDALLLADAVAAHGPAFSRDGSLDVRVEAQAGRIALVVGELREQGARELLTAAELPGVGNVLQRVADEVTVEDAADGEAVRISLAFAT